MWMMNVWWMMIVKWLTRIDGVAVDIFAQLFACMNGTLYLYTI